MFFPSKKKKKKGGGGGVEFLNATNLIQLKKVLE
jgi:hypothetical protein